MMRTLSLLLALATMMVSTTYGFAPMSYVPPAPIEVNVAAPTFQQQQQAATNNQLTFGVENYVASSIESSSQALSLKERPPPPTKEEIEEKQRNFNLIFWGGGFVAPFIATVFYFGPKFWLK